MIPMISHLTFYLIQIRGDDVRCEPLEQDKKTNLWAGAINLYNNGSFHRIMLSTKPIYKTSEEAVAATQELVKKIRSRPLFQAG